MWLKNESMRQFTNLYGPDFAQIRTTNNAESYHSKLKHHYWGHMKYGEWITEYHRLTNTEQQTAWQVFEGNRTGRRVDRDFLAKNEQFLLLFNVSVFKSQINEF